MSAHQQNLRLPVYLSLIVIGVLVASIVFLLRRPSPKPPEIVLRTSQPAFVRGADQPNTGKHPRTEWAEGWQKRLNAKGWHVTAKTSGAEHRTLELHWGQDRSRQDEQHMEKLQVSDGFFQMLRDRHFDRLMMFIKGRRIFNKPL